MPRRNADRSLRESAPQAKPRQPWQECASNKHKKKRIVEGQPISSHKRPVKRHTSPCTTDRSMAVISSLVECFSDVDDPRVNRKRRHLLIDIVVIATLAVMCNADGWKEIYLWGDANHQWLQTFLELPNGIPSRDTFRRTISRLNPEQFERAFLRWLRGINRRIQGVIAIDGKTLRGSRCPDKDPLHIVSAWACEQHLTLGQRTVDGKSNEITAIPELLATLALKGAIVTIDAMGCQKNIVAQIVEAHGDYCLAVKDNQPTLAEDIAQSFTVALESDLKPSRYEEHSTHDQQFPA